jgi:hypothetical protein
MIHWIQLVLGQTLSSPKHQAWLLSEHLDPREKKLRVIDVREMFVEMRDET